MIAEVTEGIDNDKAPRAATARRRRAAGQFARLPIAQAAVRFALARHAHQHREFDHAPFIAHPIEVGSLLRRDGQPDEMIAGGLLDDILEKTATTSAELHRRFGPGQQGRLAGCERLNHRERGYGAGDRTAAAA